MRKNFLVSLVVLALVAATFLTSCASKGKTLVPVVDADGVRVDSKPSLIEERFPDAKQIVLLATSSLASRSFFFFSRSQTDMSYHVTADHYEALVDLTVTRRNKKKTVKFDIDYTRFDPVDLKQTESE